MPSKIMFVVYKIRQCSRDYWLKKLSHSNKHLRWQKSVVVAVQEIVVPRHPPCKHCGQNNHAACDCRFQAVECYNYGKLGHITLICHAPKNQRSKESRKIYLSSTHKTEKENWIACQQSHNKRRNSDRDEQLSWHTVANNASSKLIMVTGFIEGKKIAMEVNTKEGVAILS